jgi:hypothetical protein
MTMTLEDVRLAAKRFRNGHPGETLLEAVEIGDGLEVALSEPGALDEISRRIVGVASRLECGAILGASSIGDRIAGAAVAVSGNGLRTATPKSGNGHVLIVDGVLYSGVQLARAAQKAKTLGADRVSAAVLLSFGDGEEINPDVEGVEILLAD